MTMDRPKRVLIVDDSEPNRDLLEAMVNSLGHEPVLAQDGLDALAKAKQRVDLVLLDALMPGMDGFTVAKRIRQDPDLRLLPIIMVTVLEDKEDRLRAVEAGANDFISKPVDQTELKVRTESLLKMKEAQDGLKRKNQELEDTNAGLEAFVASMSQDLNAPLRGIRHAVDVLMKSHAPRLELGGRECVRSIGEATQRLDLLLKDLLDYSRLGRAEMHRQPVELAWVVPEVLAQFDEEIRKKKAQVTVEQPLPPVLGHRGTLVQALANLLANALKFVAPSTQPKVRIRAEEQEESVRLWVEDNGIGVAPEQQTRLFRAFERLRGTEAYPGTGIGLAIVRKGVEHMGGRVGVESSPDQGSKFWMELPKAQTPGS